MAEDYSRIYQQLLSRSSTQAAAWSRFLRSRQSAITLDDAWPDRSILLKKANTKDA